MILLLNDRTRLAAGHGTLLIGGDSESFPKTSPSTSDAWPPSMSKQITKYWHFLAWPKYSPSAVPGVKDKDTL